MPAETALKMAEDAQVLRAAALVPGQFARGAVADRPGCSDRFGPGRRHHNRRLVQVFGRLIRARSAHPGHDPLFGHPDMIENDYYRFLANPRG